VLLAIQWCHDPLRARELAEFFSENIEPEYISHSELQGPRALSPNKWRDGLPEIFLEEINARIAETGKAPPTAVSKPVLFAEADGRVVAFGLVTFAADAAVPYAIVEDIVVEKSSRGRRTGLDIMNWIADEARSRNIVRLFLESGKNNHRAHHFFEGIGFEQISIVMMKSL